MKSSVANDNTPVIAPHQGFMRLRNVMPTNDGMDITVSVSWSVGRWVSRIVKFLQPIEDAVANRNVELGLQRRSQEVQAQRADATRREFQKIGRLASSMVRRMVRDQGMKRREALAAISPAFGYSATILESMVSRHNKARDRRTECSRNYLIPKWLNEGLARKDIAERLNVSVVQVGRLIKAMEQGGTGGVTC